jgi:FkbM family methyltransferase
MKTIKSILKRLKMKWLVKNYHEPELKLVSNFKKNNGIFLDIGANIGIYSFVASKIFGKVYAFEPNPIFRRSFALMRLSNCVLNSFALGSQSYKANLNIPVALNGDMHYGLASIKNISESSTSIEVDVCSVDSFYFTDVVCMKIDVEGFEEEVLEGSKETILRCYPIIIVEIEERHNPGGYIRIFDMLSRKYNAYSYIYNGQIDKIIKIERNRDKTIKENLKISNNVVFVPRNKNIEDFLF